ncbi:NAD-dependent epimerase/dehydratase family protein [Streptomyces fulvissimus]|uniref:NAD-dependent epimerase/dehydratase family protein n=1 Tax=Streptomyces microflavus TaxID=1919 RepID=A0A6N9VCW8_STRMI|nr:NAD-dependent epimerase/dehydratase family protein [Streptomyces microflavus]NEB70327.1 NAD-dependent epimerase/dehydratase family protein [Streptomyces microflavus]NEE55857.1 NAD-dependent epimerase/dehydratase family protein [Streptomyces sp. SID8455]
MTKHVLLTGGGGFVGSHVLRHLMTNTDWTVTLPVTFRHKGVPKRIASALETNPEWWDRVDVVYCDLTAPIDPVTAARFGKVDYLFNVASESHVDRSIDQPGPFIENNVRLITNILDYARQAKPSLVLQMSTDEVYGPAPDGYEHREWDAIAPSNPYSASKAAQEAVCFTYWRTYGVPVVITNTMNILGEQQDTEKFIPKTMRAILQGEPATVHVSPGGRPGSRFYLHARNLADAWLWLARNHKPQQYGDFDRPSRFHIVGEREVDNIEMVHLLADLMGTGDPKLDLVDFHSSRPGHDLRYALDGGKLAAAGWQAPLSLEESLRRTVEWTLRHPEWLGLPATEVAR